MFVFKPRTQDFLCSYSPDALMEGEWCRLEVPEERLGCEALGEEAVKQQQGVLQSVIPNPSTKAATFPARCRPLQQPQLGIRQIPHSRGYSSPHPQNPPGHTLHLDLCRGNSCKGQPVGLNSIREHQRLTWEWGHPPHCPRNMSDASPSQKS